MSKKLEKVKNNIIKEVNDIYNNILEQMKKLNINDYNLNYVDEYDYELDKYIYVIVELDNDEYKVYDRDDDILVIYNSDGELIKCDDIERLILDILHFNEIKIFW